jgi:hypothetical protein
MDQDERERANPVQKRKCELFNHNRFGCPWTRYPEMNHVIHYHLPSKEDEFTHRNGRTARMLASEPPISLLMKVRKMDYIDYGSFESGKLHFITKTT